MKNHRMPSLMTGINVICNRNINGVRRFSREILLLDAGDGGAGALLERYRSCAITNLLKITSQAPKKKQENFHITLSIFLRCCFSIQHAVLIFSLGITLLASHLRVIPAQIIQSNPYETKGILADLSGF